MGWGLFGVGSCASVMSMQGRVVRRRPVGVSDVFGGGSVKGR